MVRRGEKRCVADMGLTRKRKQGEHRAQSVCFHDLSSIKSWTPEFSLFLFFFSFSLLTNCKMATSALSSSATHRNTQQQRGDFVITCPCSAKRTFPSLHSFLKPGRAQSIFTPFHWPESVTHPFPDP